MKWIVGATSCGLNNYTKWQESKGVFGLCETDQRLRKIAVKKYHNEMSESDASYLIKRIKERIISPFSFIADCSSFIFIPEIIQYDPNAEFVWIIRDHNILINDLMNKHGENERIHPKQWDFCYKNKRILLDWYVIEVNAIIQSSLINQNFTVLHTEDMPHLVEAKG